MDVGVYVPLLLPIVAVPLVRWLAGRLHPAWATWLVTSAATILAAGATLALSLLTLAGLSALSDVARWGHWSVSAVRQSDVVEAPIDGVAALALVVCGVAALSAAVRRVRAMAEAHRTAARSGHGGELVVVHDERPLAHALPGRPGRIVVSTTMLRVLGPDERRALLAHERAHLAYRHHLFVAVVDIMAAANPLLWPLTAAIRYTTERWADEFAAVDVGNRTVVARAVGKAALATRRNPGKTANAVAMAATAGPVPRRVAALLAAPPARHVRAVLASPTGLFAMTAVALTVGSALFAAEAATDLHRTLELAQVPPASATTSAAVDGPPSVPLIRHVTRHDGVGHR